MQNTQEEKDSTMFDKSKKENMFNWLMIIFILVIVICVMVIIIDCAQPISYGVHYSTGTGTDGFIFFRNGTYKAKLNTYYGYKEYEGKYTIIGNNKLKIEDVGLTFEIMSRTKIKSGNETYKSSASVGIIVCSILLSLCGAIVLYWFISKRMNGNNQKEDRIAELEKQVADLQAKVDNKEEK